METAENPGTWEPGHPCPISRKPHKYICGGNRGNLQKPKKPTEKERYEEILTYFYVR